MKNKITNKLKKRLHIKTVRSRIVKPDKNDKITYTVEPINAKTRDPTVSGDVYKKYKNGKLVKQVFVSKNRLKEIIAKIQKKNSKKYLGIKLGGIADPKEQPVITVASGTSLFQAFKEGLAGGLGSAIAWFSVASIFQAIMDDE